MDEPKSLMNQFIGCALSDEMYYVHLLYDMDNSINTGFQKWFSENMIYCQDAHSFVHRLFSTFPDCESYRDAQNKAWKILDRMRLEYLYTHYNTDSLKDIFAEIKKAHPRPDYKRLSKKVLETLKADE